VLLGLYGCVNAGYVQVY